MVTHTTEGEVEFRFYRPGASEVTLAGDFNDWHRTSIPMARAPDGYWRHRLRLGPGVYQFKYHCDGEWYADYAAFGLEHGPYGWNSVVRVDSPA